MHRLLAACIGADSTYSDLLDKRKSAHLCNNLNYRNRMAQYAGRASVGFEKLHFSSVQYLNLNLNSNAKFHKILGQLEYALVFPWANTRRKRVHSVCA